MPQSPTDSQSAVPTAALSFALGEHHVADETAVPEGYARRVVNWDIDDSGRLDTRPAFTPLPGLPGAHSMWTSNDHSLTLAFVGSELHRLVRSNLGTSLVPVGFSINGRGRVWYAEVNGDVYFSNGTDGGVLRPSLRVDPLGVDPALPASPDPYAVSEVVDDRQFLQSMPQGRYLAVFAGRLWVVQGDTIYHSQPLNYRQHDRRYDFITAPGYITAFGAVSDGLYVSTSQEVYFLRGRDPREMEMVKCSDAAAVLDSQVYLPFDVVDTDALAVNGSQYQVSNAFGWLCRAGLAVGIPSGVVRILTASRARLPLHPRAHTALIARGGFHQVVSVVDPTDPVRRGHAVDSLVR